MLPSDMIRPEPPIPLVGRDECLRANPYLAHAVAGWQRAHAPEEGEAEWLAEACDAIVADPQLRWAESLTLYLPTSGIEETAAEMGPALGRMLAPFGGGALTFLHAWPSGRWPTRRRSPAVVATAARAFREMGAGGSFDGGIRIAATDAEAVFAPLLWSVRMDMGYGPVYIAHEGVPFVASLCQYANLHVDVYAPGAAGAIRDAARAAGFVESTDGVCDERFESGGAISGRRLRIDA